MRRIQYLLVAAFFMLLTHSCSDSGGQLTEARVCVTDAATGEKVDGVFMHLYQTSSFQSQYIPEVFEATVLDRTNSRGCGSVFFFSNEGTNSFLKMGMLSDTAMDCYPRMRLLEGDLNEYDLRAVIPTSTLHVDFTNLRNRVGSDVILYQLVHYPGETSDDICAAIVYRDSLEDGGVNEQQFKIYPFGRYMFTAYVNRNPSVFDYHLFRPNETDTLINIMLQ